MSLQGNFIDYISAFFGGVLVSFSPCVYPLIPLTLGFIGVTSRSSRLKGLSLSMIFVFGIAITYSILGLIASLSGSIFGIISTHPVSYFLMGNVCIVAALSFFDVIYINFTGLHLENKIKRSGGFMSVLLLGLVAGLMAGPCATPALGVILTYVATRKNVIYGTSLLFVFAYGMGFLLILVGTFSALIFNLFKSEIMLRRIRKLSGFILLAMGEYFLIKAGGAFAW